MAQRKQPTTRPVGRPRKDSPEPTTRDDIVSFIRTETEAGRTTTINDIAEEVGISRQAVTLHLNALHGNISQPVRGGRKLISWVDENSRRDIELGDQLTVVGVKLDSNNRKVFVVRDAAGAERSIVIDV